METNEIKETDSRRESTNEAPDPMEELKCGIDELRGKLKLLLDETGFLTRKVKEAVLKRAGFHPRQFRHRTDLYGDSAKL